MKVLRVIASIVCFFAALAGVALSLSRIDPFGEVPIVREKWAWYTAHKDDFDTLFLGTSRTFRGVMPPVFDQLTAAAGLPTKS